MRNRLMHRPSYLRYPFPISPGAVLLFALVLLALGIGLRDPWPADEPRFVLIAQEMIQTGQFWIPHRAGELYPDKPPIYMWATALSLALTQSVRLGFLLPSLLSAMGTLWLVADLAKRLYGRRVATLAACALLSTVLFGLQAKTAQIDMLLTFFTTLGAYGFMRHALLGPARRWWLTGWAAIGLGILTKGVGILPLLLLPVWVVLARRSKVRKLGWRDVWQGLAVLLGVLALWGVPMIIVTTFSADPALAAYRDNILFKQTGERYVSAWHHVKPWWYYLVEVLPWAWMPLVLAFPWAVPAWARRLRRGDARIWLPLGGALLIVMFFSLSPGKRGVYILPSIPLLVMALAPLLPGLLSNPVLQRLGAIVLTVFGALFLAAGALGWAQLPALARLAERYDVQPWLWWIVLGVAAGLLLAWLRPRQGIVALVLWLAAFWAAWSTFGYVQLNEPRSPQRFMQHVVAVTSPHAVLAIPFFDEEFVLQAQQPIVHFGFHTPDDAQLSRAFHWLQEHPSQRWMLVKQKRREQLGCVDLEQAVDMGHQNSEHWWLIPAGAVAGCPRSHDSVPLFVAPTTARGSHDLPGGD